MSSNIRDSENTIPKQIKLNIRRDEKVLYNHNSLVLTDKRVHYQYSGGYYLTMFLKDVIFIGHTTKGDDKEDSNSIGRIYLVSDNVKSFDYRGTISIKKVNNVSEKVQRIESILWYYGDVKKRWTKISKREGITLPYQIETPYKSLTIRKNGVMISEGGNERDLLFQNLQLKINQFKDKLTFISDNDKVKVKLGERGSSLDTIEKVYLAFCLWKKRNNYFLHKQGLSELIFTRENRKHAFNKEDNNRIGPLPADLKENIDSKLKSGENILLSYPPMNRPKSKEGAWKTTCLLSIGVLIFVIFQSIKILSSKYISLTSFLILFVALFIFIGLCCFSSKQHKKHIFKEASKSFFVFTTQRIITNEYKVPYSNISMLKFEEHPNDLDIIYITIFFKNRMVFEGREEEGIYLMIYPKNFKVVEKVKEINRQHII